MPAESINQYEVVPLYGGEGEQAWGVYRRTKYGWYRITQKPVESMAIAKMNKMKAGVIDVQASSTT